MNQEEKISDRFKKVRLYFKKGQKDFATGANIKQSQVSEIENGKRNITSSIYLALEDAYRINRKWLESGNGEMMLSTDQENARDLGEVSYPIEPGETPFIDLGEGKYIMVVPLVNEYAYAGYLSGYKDPEYLDELPKHTIIVDKHHKGSYRAFEVVGDSMDNNTNESIMDRSIATGREIQQHLWTSKFHTHRFKDYVIVHKTQGIIIKRIINHDIETGVITCHSLNPNKQIYADFDIHLDDVKQMFNIVVVTQKR